MSYCPKPFIEDRTDTLHQLITSQSLGAWTCWAEQQLVVNHIPFYLDKSAGKFGTLVGHVARVNPVWKFLQQPVPTVVVFQGPQTYISPDWYASKREHGKVVPTWNYMVVHARGEPRAVQDKQWLHEHLCQLSDTHEAGRSQPWKVSDAPDNFIDAMSNGIVGIEIPIDSLEGRWKLSQNKNTADFEGVLAGLSGSSVSTDRDMALQMSQD